MKSGRTVYLMDSSHRTVLSGRSHDHKIWGDTLQIQETPASLPTDGWRLTELHGAEQGEARRAAGRPG